MNEIEITAIIPVYNDRNALETAITQSLATLKRISDKFELLIAEDGSNDSSAEFVKEQEKLYPQLHLLHSDERLGKGQAISRAILIAKGETICYYDVDLSTDMAHIEELVGYIRGGYDIAVGSRLLPQSIVARSQVRELLSKGYNWLVKVIIGSCICDHQCGFKAFNRHKILEILPSIKATHFFWDTELLVKAQMKGLHVKEFPITWQEKKRSSVRIRDVIDMARSIFGLWWQLHVPSN